MVDLKESRCNQWKKMFPFLFFFFMTKAKAVTVLLSSYDVLLDGGNGIEFLEFH